MDGFEDHCWRGLMDPETLAIYQAYNRETFVGKRPAVLAIDLYNLVYEGGPKPVAELYDQYPSACGTYAHDAVEPIREVLRMARDQDLPVIYTTADGKARARATHRRQLSGDRDAYAIYEAFPPHPEDWVITKQRASAFFGTPLIAGLVSRGIDSLIVVGESTSGCVRASVVEAYSYGFHTIVVEEGVFDRSQLSHQVSLFDLHHKYADVMHLEELRRKLAAR